MCSGYEGIGLIWAFLTAYLVLFRRRLRFPRALLLFPIGTLVMWLANGVRIAALVGHMALALMASVAIFVGFSCAESTSRRMLAGLNR